MVMTWVSVSVVCSVVGGELADELSSMLPDDDESSLQRFTLRNTTATHMKRCSFMDDDDITWRLTTIQPALSWVGS